MNEQNLEIIHRYLEGDLPDRERADFEAAIQSDPALKSSLELERLLLAGIAQAGELDYQKTIGGVHRKLKTEGFFEAQNASSSGFLSPFFSKTSVFQRVTAIAAALALVLTAVWFFAKDGGDMDTNAVFARHYQAQDDAQRAKALALGLETFGLAGVSSESDSLREALQLFETGKYADAQILLNDLWTKHPNDTVQYYLGVAHMRRQNYPQAISFFLPLTQLPAFAWKNDALWNLGLCYLKTEGGLEKAREVFTVLARNPEEQKARSVLKQLEAQ